MTSKPRVGLIESEFLLAMGRVLEHGGQKRNEEPNTVDPSWKQKSFETHYDAALRHLIKANTANPVDKESGEDHLVHAACRIMMAWYTMWMYEEGEENTVDNTWEGWFI